MPVSTGDASWADRARPHGCAVLGDDPDDRALHCENPFELSHRGSNDPEDPLIELGESFHGCSTERVDTDVRMDIAYGAIEPGLTPSDNRATVGISHVEDPVARLQMDAPTGVATRPDQPSTLHLTTRQTESAFSREATPTAEIPDNVTVSNARPAPRYAYDPYLPDSWRPSPLDQAGGRSDREVADVVVRVAPALARCTKYAVELQLVGIAPGSEPIGLTLETDYPNVDDPVATLDVRVEHVVSTATIRTMPRTATRSSCPRVSTAARSTVTGRH